MAIPRLTVQAFSLALIISCAGLGGCASTSSTRAAKADFNGSWSVQWCDKADPDADCGGFDIELTQVGDKISGESFGARVRLAQIDEGGLVHGIAIGSTAILTIESMRSGGIYLVEATIDGRCLHWKMRDTIRRSERDIDIIAGEELLTKTSNASSNNGRKPEIDCRGIPIRRQN